MREEKYDIDRGDEEMKEELLNIVRESKISYYDIVKILLGYTKAIRILENDNVSDTNNAYYAALDLLEQLGYYDSKTGKFNY